MLLIYAFTIFQYLKIKVQHFMESINHLIFEEDFFQMM